MTLSWTSYSRVVVPAAAVRVPSLTPPKRLQFRHSAVPGAGLPLTMGSCAGSNFCSFAPTPCMGSKRRANGAGMVYLKHGCYYGRWYTPGGGRTNRKLGPARKPGNATGLTRAQAERRLRELMAEVQVTTNADRTLADLGGALLAQLEAKGRSRSSIQSVETHLRVHLVPFFGERSVDRLTEDDVNRLLAPTQAGFGAEDDPEYREHSALAVRARDPEALDP
jgi:hypothetical protein